MDFSRWKNLFSKIKLIGIFTTLCTVVLAALPSEAANNNPKAKIPRLSRKVVVDGKISSGEWNDAAVIRRIFYKKNRSPANPKTEIFVKYGNNNLYVAAVCYEPNRKYPEAYPRKWNDLLFRNDDAVQVVLGMEDTNIVVKEKINMGGYEGALDGKATKADFYYCFTVNAAGSKQRSFNETLLENALFDAVAGKTPGEKWEVEFKIPFSSFGLKSVPEKAIFPNLFRFRPPVMTGWNYPNFWGYSAMPFGMFKFLPDGQQKLKTVENFPANPKPLSQKCAATIQYSPLSGAIIGKAVKSGKWGKLYGVLKVSGFPDLKELLDFKAVVNHDAVKEFHKPQITAIIREITPGDQPSRVVSFKIIDEKGKTISRASKRFDKVTAPEWFGTKNGEDYVSRKFPSPWTEPVLNGNKIKLVDKEITFNKFCLPTSVRFTATGEELLAAEPYIEVKIAGKTLKFKGSSAKLVKDGNSCRISSVLRSDKAILKIKSKIEPDGFTVVKFKLGNINLKSVDKVSLRIPLKNENAKFVMHGPLVQKTGNISSAGFRDCAASLWVGTYDKGLSFNFDNPLFFSKDLRHQIEITPEKNTTWLNFNFCDGPGQLEKDTIFRFFLHPTPTKPQPSKRIRKMVQWKWERWGRWHGYPDVSKIPELQKWVSKLKKKNRIGLLYTCQGLQVDSPGFKQFRSDLELQPRWRYYRNKGKDCFATSKRGPEGDLQL
jgi:Glycoside hydrolase 123, N-terminal domain